MSAVFIYYRNNLGDYYKAWGRLRFRLRFRGRVAFFQT
ncbi:MAG: hypothetical protein ACI9Z9_002002, partial [Litorivivens sp.]